MTSKLNRDRIFKAADAYIRSGKVEKAVGEYEKWVSANPKDWNTIRQIGDLYARIGKNDQAIKKYTQIAEYYRSDGFNVRAIATYKMILRLDPQNEPAMANLAELQVAQGLLMEAKSQYQALVELYNKSGQKRRAAEVFKKLAEIDPSDLKVRYKFAEFMDKHGQVEEAITEYIGIADEFINNGLVPEAIQIMEKGLRIDNANRSLRSKLAQAAILQGDYSKAIQILGEVRDKYLDDAELLSRLGEAYMGAGKPHEADAIFRRLAELQPDNPEHASRMAELAVGQGDFDHALQVVTPAVDRFVENGDGEQATLLLHKIVNREPHHVKTLLKLAEVHTILKQEQARISAYDQLCEAYTHQGDFEKAARVAEQLVELEPENSQHRDRLRFLKSRLEPAAVKPAPVPEPEIELPDLETMEASDDLVDLVSESASDVALEQGQKPESIAAEGQAWSPEEIALSEEDEEHIREKLTEAEVFVRYGLVEKALEQLKDVLRNFPFHSESREKLIEIYKDQGMNREASDEMAQLARVYERLGQRGQADELFHDAQALNPAAPDEAPMGTLEAEEEIELTLTPEEGALESDLVVAPSTDELEEIPGAVEEEIPAAFEEISAFGEEIPASQEEVPVTFHEEIQRAVEEEIPVAFEEEEVSAAPVGYEEPTLEEDEEFPIEVDLDAEEATQEVTSEAEPLPTFGEEEEELAEVGIGEEGFEVEDDTTEVLSGPPEGADFGEGDEFQFDLPSTEAPPVEAVGEAEEELLQDQPDLTMENMPMEFIQEHGQTIPVDEEAEEIPFDVAEASPEREPSEASLAFNRPIDAAVPRSASSELAEVDEYISLGLYEDARDSLRELLRKHPGDVEILAKIEEVGFSASQLQQEAETGATEPERPVASHPIGFRRPAPSPEWVEGSATDGPLASIEGLGEPEFPRREAARQEGEQPYVDLASELSQEIFGTQSAVGEEVVAESTGGLSDPGLDEIFREFKKGVEKQLGTEDYDTRYNLGIAYKEMGLLDEAIAEFQLACKDETRLLECCSMLGLCFLEKGMPDIAIKWFEKGLAAAGRSDEEYHGLRYDLAQAYEAAGNSERALELYMDIYRVNARFRDVRERVRELQAAKN